MSVPRMRGGDPDPYRIIHNPPQFHLRVYYVSW